MKDGKPGANWGRQSPDILNERSVLQVDVGGIVSEVE